MTEKILLGKTLRGTKAELDLQEHMSYKSPRHLYRWPKELYNYVHDRRQKGVPPRVIARKTGIPVATIYMWNTRPPKWVSDVFHPENVDGNDLSYVLGVILGDGYIGGPNWFLKKSYPISLTVKDRDFAQAFANALSSVLGKPVKVIPKVKKYKGNPWFAFKVQTKNRAFSLWYHTLNLSLIEIITMRSKAYFIRGFADSEGNVRKKGNAIRIYNKDKAKLELVRRILSRMSINTHFVEGIPPNHTVSHLAIYGGNVRRFSREIGFSIRRKQERLEANLR